MDAIITADVHKFMFKWRDSLSFFTKLFSRDSSWKSFLITKKTILDNTIMALAKPTYIDAERKIKPKIHKKNNTFIPDISVCEYLCYPNDYVINVIGLKNAAGKYGYVIFTAFGTIEIYFDNIKIVKFGALRYADKIIEIIKSLKHINTIEECLDICNELDIIQEHICLSKKFLCMVQQ